MTDFILKYFLLFVASNATITFFLIYISTERTLEQDERQDVKQKFQYNDIIYKSKSKYGASKETFNKVTVSDNQLLETVSIANKYTTGKIFQKNNTDDYVHYDKFIRHKGFADKFITNFAVHPVSKCNSETKLLILINSNANHTSARSAIRRLLTVNPTTKVYFLIGLERKSTVQFPVFKASYRQQRNHLSQNLSVVSTAKERTQQTRRKSRSTEDGFKLEDDVIVLDIQESYASLTEKIGGGLFWALKFCPQSESVLKVDDDVFLNYHNLQNYMKQIPPYSLFGKVCHSCIPFSPGGLAAESENLHKYPFVVTRRHFPTSRLPHFVFGPAYGLSTSVLPALLAIALEIDYIPYYEDLFWTGIIPSALREKLLDNPDFQLKDQIDLLRLQYRDRIHIKNTLDFLDRLCDQSSSKFALDSVTLSQIQLTDIPHWRTELHKCLGNEYTLNQSCTNFVTVHGVHWEERVQQEFMTLRTLADKKTLNLYKT